MKKRTNLINNLEVKSAYSDICLGVKDPEYLGYVKELLLRNPRVTEISEVPGEDSKLSFKLEIGEGVDWESSLAMQLPLDLISDISCEKNKYLFTILTHDFLVQELCKFLEEKGSEIVDISQGDISFSLAGDDYSEVKGRVESFLEEFTERFNKSEIGELEDREDKALDQAIERAMQVSFTNLPFERKQEILQEVDPYIEEAYEKYSTWRKTRLGSKLYRSSLCKLGKVVEGLDRKYRENMWGLFFGDTKVESVYSLDKWFDLQYKFRECK